MPENLHQFHLEPLLTAIYLKLFGAQKLGNLGMPIAKGQPAGVTWFPARAQRQGVQNQSHKISEYGRQGRRDLTWPSDYYVTGETAKTAMANMTSSSLKKFGV